MLIVAICAIMVTKITGKLMVQMQRSANVAANQQAYWYALGAEAFAGNVLRLSFEQEPDITHLGQYWAQGETSYPVDFGSITGEIFDLQACFNLNALRAKPKAQDQNNDDENPQPSPNSDNKKSEARLSFERLLIALEIESVDQFTAEYLADALTDWLDKDDMIVSAGGAEDSDYSSKEFPYLTANHYLASVSELRIIEHFTPAIIEALKKYVCVIPNSEIHKININTLDNESTVLLQALLDISADEASNILSDRGESGFEKTDDIWQLSSISKQKISRRQKQQFVVDSNYFKLKTMASANDSYVYLNSVFSVAKDNSIDVIARSIGRE